MPITPVIAQSRSRMDAALHRDVNPDMKVRHFCVFGKPASLYFAEGLCSVDFLQHYVLAPLTALRDAPLPAELATALRCAAYAAVWVNTSISTPPSFAWPSFCWCWQTWAIW